MATFHFTREFIERCWEFIRSNPRVADSPQELIIRSGRMALHIMREKFGDCNDARVKHTRYRSNRSKLKKDDGSSGNNSKETLPIRIPDEDVRQVRELIRKLGLGRTVINFYYFATWMVLLGIWKLPEKPPY